MERLKARLVAKGFYTRQEGVDFIDTLFPIAEVTTIRTLLSFDACQGWYLRQLDINNASYTESYTRIFTSLYFRGFLLLNLEWFASFKRVYMAFSKLVANGIPN